MSKFLEEYYKYYFPENNKNNKTKIIKSQLELLKFLAAGYTLKEIAQKTNKKYYNIQKRTQNLYKKFWVDNRSDLICKSIEEGILSTRDVKQLFKKRFTKITIKEKEIKLLEPLSNRAMLFLKLKSVGKSDNEIIKLLNLYGTYPIWEIKRELYYKFDCDNMLQVINKAFKLEII